jgi:hypothetical protein
MIILNKLVPLMGELAVFYFYLVTSLYYLRMVIFFDSEGVWCSASWSFDCKLGISNWKLTILFFFVKMGSKDSFWGDNTYNDLNFINTFNLVNRWLLLFIRSLRCLKVVHRKQSRDFHTLVVILFEWFHSSH